ncbi:MAG: D-aminoacyl-tRNA deacylase [Aureliella sp.]
MRAVVQRVTEASVVVEGRGVGGIQAGLLVLLGVESGDGDADLNYICNKLLGLRVFPDADGLMNQSVQDTQGEILVVSQFTLLGDVRKGRRPSFIEAALPADAKRLYDRLCKQLAQSGLVVETGEFQADMKVSLVNDGPVTILLDSRKKF